MCTSNLETVNMKPPFIKIPAGMNYYLAYMQLSDRWFIRDQVNTRILTKAFFAEAFIKGYQYAYMGR